MDSDQGKLFIGGISWETTEEKLKDYFNAYGKVVETVIMKDRATGRARGFGFVVFADPSVADLVVQDKHTIDGRTVEAKKAVPREEQQNAVRSNNGGLVSANQARTKKIFVGGLASTVTENDFRKYFAQYGTITDVVVMYDHSTQRPRGFGFITYDSEDAVDKVLLQKSFHELNGKMVEVKRAIPKELSPGPTRNSGSGFSVGVVRGGNYAGGYGQAVNSSPVGPYGSRMDSRYGPSPVNRTGYLSYGAPGFGSSGNYSPTMNGGYGATAYGGSGNFGGSGYAGSPSGSGGYGGSGGLYGSSAIGSGYSSVPGRSVWGSGGISYGSGGVLAGYGASGGSGLSGYGGAGTWGSTQSPNSSAGYSNSTYGYGSSDKGYGSGIAGYTEQVRSYGSPVSGYGSGRPSSGGGAYSGVYGDMYSSAGYGDSTWRSSGADPFNLINARLGGTGTGAYGLSGSGSGEVAPTSSGGYAKGGQSHRGVPA